MSAEQLTLFPVGCIVRIDGLKKEKGDKYNGKKGRVTRWSGDKVKIVVDAIDTKEHSLRPSYLTKLSSPADRTDTHADRRYVQGASTSGSSAAASPLPPVGTVVLIDYPSKEQFHGKRATVLPSPPACQPYLGLPGHALR